MKTYDIDFSGSTVEADGPRGAFVKTSDHCEVAAEYEEKLRALHGELNAECARYHLARAQLAARDAALDAVLALALKQRDGGDMDLERAGGDMCDLLLKHGVHPK